MLMVVALCGSDFDSSDLLQFSFLEIYGLDVKIKNDFLIAICRLSLCQLLGP